MASGDAGEILRKIADLQSAVDRLQRQLTEVQQTVQIIRNHGSR